MMKLRSRPQPAAPGASRQRGAALVVGMVILALVTLLGMSSLGTSVLERRMADNARDRVRAFEAAETALRACEARVPGLRHATVIPVQSAADLGIDLPLLAEQPQCAVTRVQTVTLGSRSMETAAHETDSHQVYRLTATGRGINPNTTVRLEVHVRARI